MTESTTSTISIAVHDTLPDVLDRLRGAGDTPITLEIPAGSPLFLTANEFRALRTAVDREHLALTIASNDSLRQQLATMFGLAIEANGQVTIPTKSEEPRPPKQWTSTRFAPKPSAQEEIATTIADQTDDGERSAEEIESEPSRGPSPRTLLIGGIAALALVAFLGFLASYFFLPRATIAIELKREPLSDELILGVAPAGAPALPDTDLTVPAQPVVADVTVTLSTPATGEKLLPDQPAAGSIRLSNPTAAEITVPKETQVTSSAGVTYAFTDDAPVPAAADGQPTFVDARVIATGGGAAGNLDVGALSGKLDVGVYYSNRMGPIEGGTDRAVKVVGEADLENLRGQIDQALRDDALTAFEKQLSGGEQVVKASLVWGEISPTFDRQVDEEAESVGVTTTVRVTAIKYNAADAVSQAEDALRTRLAEAAPEGYELAPSTLVLDGPVLLDEGPDGSRFKITATASAAATFPPEERDRLANDLTGKDDDEVATILQALPGVESFDVSYAPGFLGERMPRVGGQIRIETDV
ncbi:MAG: hypothetical protein ACRDJH_23620 [Thermomicrobiales bacterium]